MVTLNFLALCDLTIKGIAVIYLINGQLLNYLRKCKNTWIQMLLSLGLQEAFCLGSFLEINFFWTKCTW